MSGEKEAAADLLRFLNDQGSWCESAVIAHGSAWHLTLDEYHRFETLCDTLESALEESPHGK